MRSASQDSLADTATYQFIESWFKPYATLLAEQDRRPFINSLHLARSPSCAFSEHPLYRKALEHEDFDFFDGFVLVLHYGLPTFLENKKFLFFWEDNFCDSALFESIHESDMARGIQHIVARNRKPLLSPPLSLSSHGSQKRSRTDGPNTPAVSPSKRVRLDVPVATEDLNETQTLSVDRSSPGLPDDVPAAVEREPGSVDSGDSTLVQRCLPPAETQPSRQSLEQTQNRLSQISNDLVDDINKWSDISNAIDKRTKQLNQERQTMTELLQSQLSGSLSAVEEQNEILLKISREE